MYKLLYGVSEEMGKQIAVCDTIEQVNKRIVNYLNERNIESYYQRRWMTPEGTTVVDYGSWAKFFYIVPVNDKTVQETFREGSDV
jgi:hypothetical protein